MTLGVHGAAMQAGAHMPLRKIADSGMVFGLGTDATIVSHYSPFVTLGWVVSGVDVGGNRVLDETLTREEALVAHTRSNAYLFFQENALGSLEVGKQADLVVLDRDYMTVPAAQIKHIKPTLTMVGGRVVDRRPEVVTSVRQKRRTGPTLSSNCCAAGPVRTTRQPPTSSTPHPHAPTSGAIRMGSHFASARIANLWPRNCLTPVPKPNEKRVKPSCAAARCVAPTLPVRNARRPLTSGMTHSRVKSA